jgi:Tannase and feruloyl esterase
MQRGVLVVLASALLGSAALTPAAAFAAPPTCAELALNPAFGLAGNRNITATASDNQGIASPSATVVVATATNAAYCNVQIQFSSKSGPSDGYAPGESQTIGIGIGLPLNSTDGGTGGVEGAWNGKVENLGGGGLIGTIGSTTAATNAGFVGSSTDGGHNTSQNGGSAGNFGVIQSSHQLDVGKLTDFASEAQHQQYLWALAVAEKYYGRAATRNYWNGCSTGGRQGLELAQKWGEDFDGILAGAPVTYNLGLDLSHIWPALVNRDDVVASGHPAITTGQYSAAVTSAIAACDVQGTDVVADGVVDDPRQCTWHASNNICGRPGAPASPNCLDPVQAAGIDKIWDGARNHHGQRMWFPYLKNQTGGTFVLDPAFSSFQGLNAFTWNHRDLTFSAQNVYSTRKLAAANPLRQPAPIALEDEWVMLDGPGGAGNFLVNDDYQGIIDRVHFGHKHGKIIMWQGSADPFVPWQDSIHFYRAMATEFGDGKADFAGLSSWYRYYHAPGVGHCGGGVGASPLAATLPNGNSQIFDDLVKWVEHDIVPQSAGDSTHVGILATGPGSFGTRPICPFPTTAIYNGRGSTAVASNYHCGGNLESSSPTPATNNVVTICEDLVTVYGREDSNELDYKDLDINPGQCPRHDGRDHHADKDR